MSTRSLLRGMLITGGSEAISVVLAITRGKALALMLGPPGVGLLGLYLILQSAASAAAGLGLDSSGVRELAQSKSDPDRLGRVRRVLLIANFVQGLIALTTLWVFRRPVSVWLFDSSVYATEVGLVGVAVLLTLLATSQTALLRGTRQIALLGRVTVFGALAGTVGGISAIWGFGMGGLIWFVLLQPLTTALVAAAYTRALWKRATAPSSRKELWRIWKPMVVLGSAFVLGTLIDLTTQLLVRGKITDDLGLDAAGQFSAAWSITVTYIGFLLNAMYADYYPHLAEVSDDRPVATKLINDQVQLALAIGGPTLLLMIGFAPLIVPILYSTEFNEAVSLLQWQSAGNVLKLACLPLAFAFVAAARARIFLLLEINFHGIYLFLVWFGLPVFGLQVAGTAFVVTWAVRFMLTHWLAYRLMEFRWEPLSLWLILLHVALASGVLVLALNSPIYGALAAAVTALATGFIGGHLVLEKIGPSRRTAVLSRLYAASGWPVRTRS